MISIFCMQSRKNIEIFGFCISFVPLAKKCVVKVVASGTLSMVWFLSRLLAIHPTAAWVRICWNQRFNFNSALFQVVFKEIFRIMKPGEWTSNSVVFLPFLTLSCRTGAIFANYEWCLTDKFDKTNPEHWLGFEFCFCGCFLICGSTAAISKRKLKRETHCRTCFRRKKSIRSWWNAGTGMPALLLILSAHEISSDLDRFEIVTSRDMTLDRNQVSDLYKFHIFHYFSS